MSVNRVPAHEAAVRSNGYEGQDTMVRIIIKHRRKNQQPWIVTLETVETTRHRTAREALGAVERWLGYGHEVDQTMLQYLRQAAQAQPAEEPAPAKADRPLTEAQRRYLRLLHEHGAWVEALLHQGVCQAAWASGVQAVEGRPNGQNWSETLNAVTVSRLIDGGWLVEEPPPPHVPGEITLPPFGTKFVLSEKAQLLLS